MIAVPATGNSLDRPQRLITRPLKIEVISIPNIIGISMRPDALGRTPFATCR